MRNLIMAFAAGATFCISGVAVEAMPVAGVPGATPTANIAKAAVVIVRRPARRVCTTRIGALGRRVTVCR